MTSIQLWGGVECTVNRVRDRYRARPGYRVLSGERGLLLRPLANAIDAYCSEMAVRLAEETRCASS